MLLCSRHCGHKKFIPKCLYIHVEIFKNSRYLEKERSRNTLRGCSEMYSDNSVEKSIGYLQATRTTFTL